MYTLGKHLYDDGQLEAARRWWERAAANGGTASMNGLGVSYMEIDSDAAQRWFEKAAAAGSDDAMNNLAWLLATQSSHPTHQRPPFGDVYLTCNKLIRRKLLWCTAGAAHRVLWSWSMVRSLPQSDASPHRPTHFEDGCLRGLVSPGGVQIDESPVTAERIFDALQNVKARSTAPV